MEAQRSPAAWNLLAQQVIVGQLNFDGTGEEKYSMDKWDGYPAARQRLLDFFGDARPANPVVFSGDNHNNWVFDLKRDFRDEHSAIVGTEIASTSITSNGDGADVRPDLVHSLHTNQRIRYHNSRRGHVRVRIEPERLHADFRVVAYVSRPGAPIRTDATFVVESGGPGAVRA